MTTLWHVCGRHRLTGEECTPACEVAMCGTAFATGPLDDMDACTDPRDLCKVCCDLMHVDVGAWTSDIARGWAS